VAFHEGATITRVEPRQDPDDLVLHLDNEQTLEADRVIVACGYRFDIERIHFLSAELRSCIKVRPSSGWPELTNGLRTTCPGLYFVGYPTEGKFGPLVRFVEGARFSAERCAASLGAS
jgi:pyruvate/2-oxoglutarate dehydrogenase complex dihydrolipoamide dehydrogenase (E3) component